MKEEMEGREGLWMEGNKTEFRRRDLEGIQMEGRKEGSKQVHCVYL